MNRLTSKGSARSRVRRIQRWTRSEKPTEPDIRVFSVPQPAFVQSFPPTRPFASTAGSVMFLPEMSSPTPTVPKNLGSQRIRRISGQ